MNSHFFAIASGMVAVFTLAILALLLLGAAVCVATVVREILAANPTRNRTSDADE